MKIVATIEARMTSSRLPGKVMMPVLGRPILSYLIDRLKKSPSIDTIVLATTTNAQDDILEALAAKEGIGCYRGSEDNVMLRVIEAAQSVNADIIVEITGDCPLIDPEVVEQVIQLFLHNPCDYASNVEHRSYPLGMDTQVYRLTTLQKSYEMATHPLDFEHVTRHIRMNPELFKPIQLIAPLSATWPELSLTLDEKADYELLKNIIEYFSDEPYVTCAQVINLLKSQHVEWTQINAQVQRKGLHA